MRTTSGGNFEGVLGFGSTPQSHGQPRDQPAVQAQQQQQDAPQPGQAAGLSSWDLAGAPEAADKKPEINFGNGGGPGWGSGQKKWRIAAGAAGPGDEKVCPTCLARKGTADGRRPCTFPLRRTNRVPNPSGRRRRLHLFPTGTPR